LTKKIGATLAGLLPTCRWDVGGAGDSHMLAGDESVAIRRKTTLLSNLVAIRPLIWLGEVASLSGAPGRQDRQDCRMTIMS
jgi:hypothetical protein